MALESDATYAALRAFTNLSHEMFARDRLADAETFVERGQALAERAGERSLWWFLVGHQLGIREWMGRWDELETLWREFDEHRDEPGVAGNALNTDRPWIVVLSRGRGEVTRASELAERHRPLAGSDDYQLRSYAEVLFAITAAGEGRHDEAFTLSMRVIQEFMEIGDQRNPVFKDAVEESLDAALALGDIDRAQEIVQMVRAIPKGRRSPMLDAAAAGYGARIDALTGGDPETIDHGFRQAERLSREIDRPFMCARYQLTHAEWLHSEGRTGEAIEFAADAGATFRSLRATPWLARRRVDRGGAG